MKWIVTSDLHIHPSRICSRDNGADRMQDGLDVLQATLNLALEHEAWWVCLGDLKTPKLVWVQAALAGIIERFDMYETVPKLIVAGNHDGVTALAPFAARKDCVSCFATGMATLKNSKVTVAVVPGTERIEDALLFLRDASDRGAEILLGHALVAGAKLGPDEFQGPGTPFDEIRSLFRFTLLGDVHKGQWFRSTGKPPHGIRWRWVPWSERAPVNEPIMPGSVLYPGSPYQQSWGEREDEPKGALLVDLDKLTVTLLPLEGFPRFIRIDWPREPLISDAVAANNFVEIIPTKPVDADAFEDIKLVARWCSVVPFTPVETVARTDREFHAGLSMRALLANYCAMRPGPPDVKPSVLLDAGIRLAETEKVPGQ